eukprot:TRINITY_DN17874_c0_g1_i9.p1 TRINITY_DN17874_c0_g1~~TRINITY_DN17874_c0_g1_i9.p1  ORF type:complete len:382 (-),score=69.03 TRINITY_DN17874_c0_g1_i9:335-1480(-)
MIQIFKDAYRLTRAPGYTGPKMIHIGGFTPWWFKYTKDGPGCPDCKHAGVETEWETMGVVGAYNAFDDGDACCVGAMANSAFYQHYPLPASLVQNPKPTLVSLHQRGLLSPAGKVVPKAYAAYYAGDYDGSAWLYNQLKPKWDDPKRGQVPIGWAVDSELSMRFPVIYPYLYRTRTANDWFISGDSGAGYLNPTLLIPDPKTGKRGGSNVTVSGADDWIAWNKVWYQKFDLTFTGFLINGDQGALNSAAFQMYDSFSPDGVVVTTGHDPTAAGKLNGAAWVDGNGTAVMHHVADLPGGNASAAAAVMVELVRADRSSFRDKPSFYIFRNILQSAGYMVDAAVGAIGAMGGELEFVDPYTMGLLVKCSSKAINCTATNPTLD